VTSTQDFFCPNTRVSVPHIFGTLSYFITVQFNCVKWNWHIQVQWPVL